MGTLIVIIVCIFGWMDGMKKCREVREGKREGVKRDDSGHTYYFFGDGD